MSLFYGIYNNSDIDRHKDRIIRANSITSEKNISSKTFIYRNVAANKFDIHAYHDQGYFEDKDMGLCLISGNPLLAIDNTFADRSQQLKKILESTIDDDWSILSNCRGQFSMVIYNQQKHSIYLIADANGSRPLYYCFTDRGLFFGTNLEIVAEIADVQGEVDWEAEVQQFTFGVPLGDRTVNRKIKVLKNGEMLSFNGGVPRYRQYFRWDTLPENNMDFAELGDNLYNIFVYAVSIRTLSCKKVLSTLSGGLDSRCVVAVLRDLGNELEAFNLSKPGEKDVIYARAYASALKLNLFEIERPEKKWSWGGLIAEALKNKGINKGDGSIGSLVFSGDGGSVGLGRVYLTENDLKCLRQNGESALARQFVTDKKRMPPISYLVPQKGSELLECLIESMRKELSDIDCPDPGKKFFLFFLQNDQRRHLHHHYENILSHKIELLVPFMDKKFTELVVSAPADMFLYHAFYHNWLNCFPETTRTVPWQTYPGHIECPVMNNHIRGIDQWEASKNVQWNVDCLYESAKIIRLTSASGEKLRAAGVKRGRVLAACLAHACGIGSYNYLFKFIKVLNRFPTVGVL